MKYFRVFQGKETGQVDGHTCERARAEAWYYEPTDYDGDTLWSSGHPSRGDAVAAALMSASGDVSIITGKTTDPVTRYEYEDRFGPGEGD